jgi:hypothetical protein
MLAGLRGPSAAEDPEPTALAHPAPEPEVAPLLPSPIVVPPPCACASRRREIAKLRRRLRAEADLLAKVKGERDVAFKVARRTKDALVDARGRLLAIHRETCRLKRRLRAALRAKPTTSSPPAPPRAPTLGEIVDTINALCGRTS